MPGSHFVWLRQHRPRTPLRSRRPKTRLERSRSLDEFGQVTEASIGEDRTVGRVGGQTPIDEVSD